MAGISGYFTDTAGQQKWIAVKVDSEGRLLCQLVTGTVNIGNVDEASVACAAADIATPAANAPAVVTYAAEAGLRHHITGVAWSYEGGIPVGGQLTITDGGIVVFDIDIAEEGAGALPFPKPKMNAAVNTAMVVTLAAGGAAITGKLNVLNHWTE